MMGYRYSVFGMQVSSDIELPELLAADDVTRTDVRFMLGKVPEPRLPSAVVEVTGEGAILTIPEVARYWIRWGNEVTVEPVGGAPRRNVRLYLLGSALGLLLHQRGMLPLHANAVEIEGRAFAFMGRSGAGKSTLAAWFHDRGYRVLSDDVCVISKCDSGQAMVWPGIARMRLWREVLEATGRDVSEHSASFIGAGAPDKFDVPLADQASTGPVPLSAIYLLEMGNELAIDPLGGAAAAEAIFANTYRGSLVARVGNVANHWSASVNLLNSVPVFRLERRWGMDELDEQLNQLLGKMTE